MQTWAISSTPTMSLGFSGQQSPRELLTDLTDAIGESDFGERALSFVNAAVSVDFMSVYSLNGQQIPRMHLSASHDKSNVCEDCFQRYQKRLFRADRTFDAAKSLASSGDLAMTHWYAAEMPSSHRDEIYLRHDISERLSVATTYGNSGLLAINMYRRSPTGQYSDREVARVESIGAILLSHVKKHITFSELTQGASRSICSKGMRTRLEVICPDLTTRELDVCERLLRGWSQEGIARDLSVSSHTVKTYRTRAFDRLGIHFKSELFALVTASWS